MSDTIKYENIWCTSIYYKIIELLTVIHCQYPYAFTNDDVKIMYLNLKKRLKLEAISSISQKPRQKYKIKNIIDDNNRCNARCWLISDINGKQCSRKKKDGFNLCKNHIKNSPHGLITDPITEHLKANFKKYGNACGTKAQQA